MPPTKEPVSHAVMVRVPLDMYRQLDEIAYQERCGVATVLRRWAAERLAVHADQVGWLKARQETQE